MSNLLAITIFGSNLGSSLSINRDAMDFVLYIFLILLIAAAIVALITLTVFLALRCRAKKEQLKKIKQKKEHGAGQKTEQGTEQKTEKRIEHENFSDSE